MAKGVDRVTAIVDAGRKRARPIVMTTIAMAAGMVPSAMALGVGGEFRAPMAVAVISGLIVSTLLSLRLRPGRVPIDGQSQQRSQPRVRPLRRRARRTGDISRRPGPWNGNHLSFGTLSYEAGVRSGLRTIASLIVVSTFGFLVGGCASLPRTPYGAADAAAARALDVTDLRRYADEPASTFQKDRVPAKGALRGPRTYLALSGGGADGAYGAGVLNGWTEAGTRPSFTIVSGVSTGALIAPFAFLGSDYDATLREIYTSGVAESLLESPNPFNAIFGSGLFGNTQTA